MHRPEREEAASLLQRTAAPPLSSIPCGNRFPGIGSTRFPGNSLEGRPAAAWLQADRSRWGRRMAGLL